MSQARVSITPADAWADSRLTPLQCRLLGLIGSYLSKEHTAWPSQGTLAKQLGVSRKAVNEGVKALVLYGYVQVQHRRRPDGGQTSSVYFVVMDPKGRDTNASDTPCNAEVTPPSPQGDTPCNHLEVTPPVTSGGDTKKDPEERPNGTKGAGRADDINRVFEHYNRTAKASGWVVCKKLTDAHKRNISGRINDYSADDVCAFIDYLARLRWTSKGFENNRSFRASLGYVMRPRTFTEHFDKMPSRGLNLIEQPLNRTDPLAQCFETYAKTGEWFGDRHGWVLKPEHPNAEYPRELYARFGLTKEIAA